MITPISHTTLEQLQSVSWTGQNCANQRLGKQIKLCSGLITLVTLLTGCVSRTTQPAKGSPSTETIWMWQDDFRKDVRGVPKESNTLFQASKGASVINCGIASYTSGGTRIEVY